MKKQGSFDKVPEADVVVRYINARFKKGLGTNVFVIGLSGTGKSSSSQRIGEIIIESRPKEELKLFVIDSLLRLIEVIKASKQGDIIVIEEVSVLFPSRRAMGRENLAISKIFDTIRMKRLCLISNCPIWNSMDKHMRSMGHLLIQTLNIYKVQGVVVSKFHRLQTDPATGKIYTHTMTRKGKEVKLMITRMPSLERWKEYEEEKVKFMDELYDELKEQQLKKKGKPKLEQPKVRDLTKRELEVHTLYNVKGLTQEGVGEKLGITQQRVAKIVENIIKKGQTPKEMGDTRVVNPQIAL